MTDMITPEKLKNPGIDYDANHLTDALAYALWHTFNLGYMQQPEQKSYACECQRCNLTHYTSYKRSNCEYCGSDDPAIFTCRELEG